MGKYRVEFGFGENFISVNEWQSIDGFEKKEAKNAEQAAKEASYTDGLENALFRVFELIENEFGELEPIDIHTPEYFYF